MTTDLFLVTYARDAKWVPYCLRSVQKYARGFRCMHVVYPTRDAEIFRPMLSQFAFTRRHEEDVPLGKGHLLQNAFKTSCDLYSDADSFFHMDSDCVLVATVRPEHQLTDGKPDLLYTPYSELPPNFPWKEVTAHALGVDVTDETMRRFPLQFPRWLYKATRERIEQVHGVPFKDYVLNSKARGHAPYGYSEFNALGNVAMHFHREKFHVRKFEEGIKPWTVKQFFSHAGVTPAVHAAIEEILR